MCHAAQRLQIVFDVKASETNPSFVVSIRMDPTRGSCVCCPCLGSEHALWARQPTVHQSIANIFNTPTRSAAGAVSTWEGLPPDNVYNAYVEVSRDDFFFVYSGASRVLADLSQ